MQPTAPIARTASAIPATNVTMAGAAPCAKTASVTSGTHRAAPPTAKTASAMFAAAKAPPTAKTVWAMCASAIPVPAIRSPGVRIASGTGALLMDLSVTQTRWVGCVVMAIALRLPYYRPSDSSLEH